jgi:hypothetical protein
MSSIIGIGYGNLTYSATLGGGSWAAAYALAKLQDRALSMVARSSSAATADTIIDWDHGSAVSARVLWVHGHNLSSSATFVVERGTTQGATDVYAGAELPVWAFTPLDGIYAGNHFGFGLVMNSANSARWTRLRIINTTNPDGYVQISSAFVGPGFFPEHSPTKLKGGWMPSFSTVERLHNGTDWVSKRAPLRAPAIVFDVLTYDEGSTLEEIIRIHDTATEVVYIAHRTDREKQQRGSFLGLFKELGELDYPFWEHNGTALGFEERGGTP